MDKVSAFFNKHKKIIIIILVIIILIVLYNKYGYLLGRLFKPQTQNNSPEALTDLRKEQIEATMKEIYSDIYDTSFWGHNYAPYEKLLGYYDNEIVYGADFYKNFLANGNKLYSDLDSQWFATGDVNLRVLSKLAELGKN